MSAVRANSKSVFASKRRENHCYCLFFQFNEKFEYNCQDCICKESTKTISCTPKVCPQQPLTNCTEPGFYPASQTDPSDPCCPTSVCRKIKNISEHLL